MPRHDKSIHHRLTSINPRGALLRALSTLMDIYTYPGELKYISRMVRDAELKVAMYVKLRLFIYWKVMIGVFKLFGVKAQLK